MGAVDARWLTSQNNSAATGTETLTEAGGGKLQVEIRANGAGADIRTASQPGTLPRSGEASSAAVMAIGLSGIGCALVTLGYGLWRRGRA
jgi:LPXTG-motif cell wall-anchored protein